METESTVRIFEKLALETFRRRRIIAPDGKSQFFLEFMLAVNQIRDFFDKEALDRLPLLSKN